MEKIFRLGVIGAGFMSNAIINGAIGSGFLKADDIIVSDINDEALKRLADKGVNTSKSNSVTANSSEYVLFAVKPQNFKEIACDLQNCSCNKFISIMAGVKKVNIKKYINGKSVARCMPNTPCSIGFGAVGIDDTDYSEENDKNFVRGLFASFATVVPVEEILLNAVTGVSGSSPAYFYLFIKSIVDAGVKNGLKREDALKLAVNTMIGSGKMIIQNNDKTLEELIASVCSKGGTTIEAMNVFNQNGLEKTVDEAVGACIKRAEELEG